MLLLKLSRFLSCAYGQAIYKFLLPIRLSMMSAYNNKLMLMFSSNFHSAI